MDHGKILEHGHGRRARRRGASSERAVRFDASPGSRDATLAALPGVSRVVHEDGEVGAVHARRPGDDRRACSAHRPSAAPSPTNLMVRRATPRGRVPRPHRPGAAGLSRCEPLRAAQPSPTCGASSATARRCSGRSPSRSSSSSCSGRSSRAAARSNYRRRLGGPGRHGRVGHGCAQAFAANGPLELTRRDARGAHARRCATGDLDAVDRRPERARRGGRGGPGRRPRARRSSLTVLHRPEPVDARAQTIQQIVARWSCGREPGLARHAAGAGVEPRSIQTPAAHGAAVLRAEHPGHGAHAAGHLRRHPARPAAREADPQAAQRDAAAALDAGRQQHRRCACSSPRPDGPDRRRSASRCFGVDDRRAAWLLVAGFVVLGALTFIVDRLRHRLVRADGGGGQRHDQRRPVPADVPVGHLLPASRSCPTGCSRSRRCMPLTYLGDALRQVMVGGDALRAAAASTRWCSPAGCGQLRDLGALLPLAVAAAWSRRGPRPGRPRSGRPPSGG